MEKKLHNKLTPEEAERIIQRKFIYGYIETENILVRDEIPYDCIPKFYLDNYKHGEKIDIYYRSDLGIDKINQNDIKIEGSNCSFIIPRPFPEPENIYDILASGNAALFISCCKNFKINLCKEVIKWFIDNINCKDDVQDINHAIDMFFESTMLEREDVIILASGETISSSFKNAAEKGDNYIAALLYRNAIPVNLEDKKIIILPSSSELVGLMILEGFGGSYFFTPKFVRGYNLKG